MTGVNDVPVSGAPCSSPFPALPRRWLPGSHTVTTWSGQGTLLAMGQQHDRTGPRCSLNEWVVLALLLEGECHGFALAKRLAPGTDLGRILTLSRPLVYRALDRLVERDLAAVATTEPGDSGPTRTVHHITNAGKRAATAWLAEPVHHVRDVRVVFLVKLRLLERLGRSPAGLIEAQQAALQDTINGLTQPPAGNDADVVDLWRSHSAAAVAQFLQALTP